uniref:Uncharacterized protein n=1 Tax=Caenorhabditis japonica TaxID=281687 RepID=A0A8R1IMD9_CAEJA
MALAVKSSPSLDRACTLYSQSDVVKQNPLLTKVTDRLALANDIFEIDRKRSVAVIENLLDSKVDNQDSQDT